jgi:hypothetical protein
VRVRVLREAIFRDVALELSNSAGGKEGINQVTVSAATKRRSRLRTTRNIKTTELAGEIGYLGTYHLLQATDLGACNFWWGSFLPVDTPGHHGMAWHLNFVGRSTIGCVTYKPPLYNINVPVSM